MHDHDDTADYVWHFKLEEAEAGQSDDALAEMVRRQISALLRCVGFTSDGQDVRVTGFRFLDDPTREHLVPPSLAEAAGSEPE